MPLTAPSKIRVRVLNGSGVAGQAAKAGASLTGMGFTVVSEGNAPGFGYSTSVVEYPAAASLPAASTLRRYLPGAIVRPDSALPAGVIELITGTRYAGLKPRRPPGPGTSGGSPA